MIYIFGQVCADLRDVALNVTVLDRRGEARRNVVIPHVKRDRVKGRTYLRKYLMIFLNDELERYDMFYVRIERKKVGDVEVPYIIIEPKIANVQAQ